MFLLQLWIYEHPGKTFLTFLVLIFIAHRCMDQKKEKARLRASWIKTDLVIMPKESKRRTARLTVCLQGKDTVYVLGEYLRNNKKWIEVNDYMDIKEAIVALELCRGCFN